MGICFFFKLYSNHIQLWFGHNSYILFLKCSPFLSSHSSREILMHRGHEGSRWIIHYFLYVGSTFVLTNSSVRIEPLTYFLTISSMHPFCACIWLCNRSNRPLTILHHLLYQCAVSNGELVCPSSLSRVLVRCRKSSELPTEYLRVQMTHPVTMRVKWGLREESNPPTSAFTDVRLNHLTTWKHRKGRLMRASINGKYQQSPSFIPWSSG